MSEIGKYNYIYGIIDDHSNVLSAISNPVVGGIVFGIPGLIGGISLSLIDALLESLSITNKRYLTQSFIGLTTGYTIYPSTITAVGGVAVGLTLSSNILNGYEKEAMFLVASSVVGATKNGLKGALIGPAVSVIDYILFYNKIVDNYYLSYCMMGVASAEVTFGSSYMADSLGLAFGLILANQTKSNWIPVEVASELYRVYSKIIPNEELNEHFKHQSIQLINIQLIMQHFSVKLLKHQQTTMYQFEHLDNPSFKLNKLPLDFLLFLLPYAFNELLSSIINSYYSAKLYIRIDDTLNTILFSGEAALKLSFDKNSTVLIDNIRLDSKEISYKGTELITDAVSKSLKGMCGVGILVSNSPDMLVYSIAYNFFTQLISQSLSTKINDEEIQIKIQESKILALLKHDTQNIRIITERGGVDFSHQHLIKEKDNLRISEFKKDLLVSGTKAWDQLVSIIDFIFNYLLVGYKITTELIDFNDRINVHFSCLVVSDILSWNGKKAQDIKSLYRSIDRIESYLDKVIINNTGSKDEITRKENAGSNNLLLSDVIVKIANKTLLQVQHIEFQMGKKYVITGPSACGKTSLLSKIIGIKENGIGGEGEILYPKGYNICVITQQDYFPLSTTLEEIIFYPNKVNKENNRFILELLKEIRLDSFSLEQQEDWYNVLSGGQKKKLVIISAIIKNPKILILDEVFNGLDKESIETIQNIINKYLNNSMVISIDHNAQENNSTGFYDYNFKVEDGQIVCNENCNKFQNEICSVADFYQDLFVNQVCYNSDE